MVNRTNEFYIIGQATTSFGFQALFRAFIIRLFPKISQYFNIKFFSAKQYEFYRSLVHDTIAYRKKNGIIRPDMINLLMEAQQQNDTQSTSKESTVDGFATVQDISLEQLKGNKQEWSDSDLTAQCFLFFVAGFETSASLMCVTVHELAENRYVQNKLYSEIKTTQEKLDGKPLTYDHLQQMKYLDMVVSGRYS